MGCTGAGDSPIETTALHLSPSLEKLLVSLLASARSRGFLGPGPVDDQLRRSLAFASIVTRAGPRALDLGSGGGLPGLVLAAALPSSTWYLLDSSPKRVEWLRSAVASLGLDARCQVLCGRAESVGRTSYRNTFDLVTARSFGAPAPTAECGAPFLHVGGELVVAEPPAKDYEPTVGPDSEVCGATARWPAQGLELLGLAVTAKEVVRTSAGPVTLSRLLAMAPCPERYPRRVGIPFKRPLF